MDLRVKRATESAVSVNALKRGRITGKDFWKGLLARIIGKDFCKGLLVRIIGKDYW